MRTKLHLVTFLLLIGFAACAQNNKPEFENSLSILVFSKTSGFRHTSISEGIKMLYDQSPKQNWIITATEDASKLNRYFLANFDVVVFLNPTGDAMDDDTQEAFENFMKSGKGFVGIHAAADFEYDWPFYGNLVGGYFKTHPPAQEATVIFEENNHPAMKPFDGMKSYTTVDEWYTFKENPRSKTNVLARVDENTIKEFKNEEWKMGDHPIIWWNEKDGIRSFYTGFGHTAEAFQDKLIIEHIKNAINWAGKRID